MSSPLKRLESRTASCANFVKSFSTDNSGTGVLTNDNHLYAIIGREDDPQGTDDASLSYVAGDGLWPVDSAPPSPTQTLGESDQFWNTAIAAKRVSQNNIYAVIPRRNWVSGNVYIPYPKNDPNYQATNSYTISDLNEVWLCVVAGPGTSTNKPIRTAFLTADTIHIKDSRLSLFSGADGYQWRYLWTLTPTEATQLTDDWIPVPVGEQLWTPSSDPQALQGPIEPHVHVHARHVAITILLDAGVNGSNKLPAGLNYRQIGFVKNPLNILAVRASLGIFYQKNTINGSSADQLIKKTGQLLHLTNIPPQFKTDTNSEFVKVYITF